MGRRGEELHFQAGIDELPAWQRISLTSRSSNPTIIPRMSSQSSDIQVQAGIDSLSLAGANILQKLMGAATADDVAPAAVIQIEQLGAMFNASGPFFEDKIHDALRRCHSRQLERIGLIVGWRKGDTCSLLAETAGGQAIALIIFCLANMTNTKSCGTIVHRLSKTLLPSARCTSAPRQLADVCALVSGKVAKLDFPAVLALQATRIRSVYLNLGQDHPRNLVEEVDWNCMVDVLEVLSSALQRTDHLLRITGTFGQAYIMSLMLVVCPDDCQVTVEGQILHQGQRNKVWVDITAKKDELTVDDYVLVLRDRDFMRCLIKPNQEERNRRGGELKYRWAGSLPTRIELLLATQKAGCPSQTDLQLIKQLFGIMVFQAVFEPKPWLTEGPRTGDNENLALNTKLFSQALGKRPELIAGRLERLLDLDAPLTPESLSGDMVQTWEAFSRYIKSAVQCRNCVFATKILLNLKAQRVCHSTQLDQEDKFCDHGRLWLALGHLFRIAVVACFVDASPDAVMHLRTNWHASGQDHQTVLLADPQNRSKWNDSYLFDFCVDMDATHDLLWHSMDPQLSFNERTRRLGIGNGSSVIIPKNLIRLSLQKDLEFGYDLLDGSFDLDGRLHSSLVDADISPLEGIDGRGLFGVETIIPTNSGCHDKVEVGAQEHHEGIMLSAMAHIPGRLESISLRRQINPAHQPLLSGPCSHGPSTTFDEIELRTLLENPDPFLFTGGVGQLRFPGERQKGGRLMVDNTPYPTRSRLMFLMTGQNRQSQFLCCGPVDCNNGRYGLVLRDCCLACAAQQCPRKAKIAYIMV